MLPINFSFKIIFSVKDENTGLYAIWKSNIDDSNLTQIITDNEMDCISPVIDPTKQLVAYVKQQPRKKKALGGCLRIALEVTYQSHLHV